MSSLHPYHHTRAIGRTIIGFEQILRDARDREKSRECCAGNSSIHPSIVDTRKLGNFILYSHAPLSRSLTHPRRVPPPPPPLPLPFDLILSRCKTSGNPRLPWARSTTRPSFSATTSRPHLRDTSLFKSQSKIWSLVHTLVSMLLSPFASSAVRPELQAKTCVVTPAFVVIVGRIPISKKRGRWYLYSVGGRPKLHAGKGGTPEVGKLPVAALAKAHSCVCEAS